MRAAMVAAVTVSGLLGVGMGVAFSEDAAAPEVVVREVASQSCVDAVEAARTFAAVASDAMRVTGRYPVLIEDAFAAGAASDVREAADVLVRVGDIGDDLDELVVVLNGAVDRFLVEASGCRR